MATASSFGRGLIAPLVAGLERAGISGALCGSAGFVLGLAAAALVVLHLTLAAFLVFVASRLLMFLSAFRAHSADRRVSTMLGVFEPIALAAMPFAFGLADPGHGPAALFLLFALIAVFAGMRADRSPAGTATEGMPFRIAVSIALAICCLKAEWFGLVAYALGITAFLASGVALASAVLDRDR